MIARENSSVIDLQRLTGKLKFATNCVSASRLFGRRMISFTLNDGWHQSLCAKNADVSKTRLRIQKRSFEVERIFAKIRDPRVVLNKLERHWLSAFIYWRFEYHRLRHLFQRLLVGLQVTKSPDEVGTFCRIFRNVRSILLRWLRGTNRSSENA